MAAYHHEFLLSGGKGDYLRRSFMGSGKVILLNAISVGLGFAVLALSQFNILSDLGKLILLTMATSSLVSLTLLPVLLEVVKPKFIRRPLPSDKFDSTTEVVS
jgi:predicted RND superfamily exporter protein